MVKTTHDLIYVVAARAKVLASMSIEDIRAEAGYDCTTRSEAIRMNKYKTRGELVEEILVEEFIGNSDPKDIEE